MTSNPCPRCGHTWDMAREAAAGADCPRCARGSGDATLAPPGAADGMPGSVAWAAGGKAVVPGAAGEPGRTPRTVGGYEVQSELGRGGMGVVYKARQTALNRTIALKVLLGGAHVSEEARARFRREAESAARVRHPNVVQVYEIGEHEGVPFVAMECVEGPTLADLARGQPLPARDAARLVEMLARAVYAVHEQDIVHRDLKPANILLQELTAKAPKAPRPAQRPRGGDTRAEGDEDEGPGDNPGLALPAPAPAASGLGGPSAAVDYLPKITDFGLAKLLDDEGSHTRSGAVLGTPSYMAPEQAAGKGYAVGKSADVYALGAILYELLTGRPPFIADAPLDTLLQVVSAEPVPPSRLQPKCPRDLETICLRCLRKEPARRYVSALSLANDLAHFLAGEPILARPVGPAERAWKWARRRPAVALLLLLVVVLAVGGFGLVAWKWQEAEQARAREADERERTEEARAGEEAQRKKAEAARKSEEALRRNAELALYFSSIALADRERTAGNVRRAAELLDRCPAALRQWEWHHLQRGCRPERARLTGPRAPVNSLARSPDGRLLASGGGHPYKPGAGGEIHLWDAATLRHLGSLNGHQDAVASVVFAPDGRTLAASSYSLDMSKLLREADNLRDAARCEARLWDTATGQVTRELADCTALAFAPRGAELAVATLGGDLVVRTVPKDEVRLRLRGPPGIVTKLAFSADGQWLVAGWMDVDLRGLRATGDTSQAMKAGAVVYDARSGDEVLNLKGQGHAELSPDGRSLATAAMDGTIRLWDLGRKQEVRAFRGHAHLVNGLAFRRDGKVLATAGMDRTVRTWDVETGREELVLRGHADMVTDVSFSPDGRELVTAGWDGAVKVWAADRGEEHRRLHGHSSQVTDLAFAPVPGEQGARLASAGADGVRLWDVSGGKEVVLLREAIQCVAVSPDGKLLAAALRDNGVGLWDLDGLRPGVPLPRPRRTLAGHSGKVTTLAFSRDGKQLASGSVNPKDGLLPGEVIVWDPATGKKARSLEAVGASVLRLAYRGDGQRLAAACADGWVRVWEPGTGRPVWGVRAGQPPFGHAVPVGCVSFSPDGRLLAGSVGNSLEPDNPGGVRFWDGDTFRDLGYLGGHSAPVTGLAFSPDGRRLASASWDMNRGSAGELKLWDLATGTELLTLGGHQVVAFSADGRFLASPGTGGFGGTPVKVWDGGPPKEK